MSQLRVAIVHSDAAFREGLRWLLQGIPESTRIDSFDSLARLHEANPRPQPHVIVAGVGTDVGAFCLAMRAMQAQIPCARWLAHLDQIQPREAALLLDQGVGGFVLRSDSQGFLFDAVRAVADGNMPISARLTRELLRTCSQMSWGRPQGAVAALSNREKELVDGLSRGLRYQDLAAEMGVSIETVRTHVRRAYAKLKVNSRSAAVAKFVRESSTASPTLSDLP